jgi:hypothetical protein
LPFSLAVSVHVDFLRVVRVIRVARVIRVVSPAGLLFLSFFFIIVYQSIALKDT